MLGRCGATQYYNEASELYNNADFEDFSWGLEEEVVNEFFSFQSFAEYRGCTQFSEPNLGIYFKNRVERKIDVSNKS